MTQGIFQAWESARPDGLALVERIGDRNRLHKFVEVGKVWQPYIKTNWEAYGNVNGRIDVGYNPERKTYQVTLGARALDEIGEPELQEAYASQLKESSGRNDSTIRRNIKGWYTATFGRFATTELDFVAQEDIEIAKTQAHANVVNNVPLAFQAN